MAQGRRAGHGCSDFVLFVVCHRPHFAHRDLGGRGIRGPGIGEGALTLLISATGMFAELQNALRRIWGSPVRDTRENL
jgi:hypothetical protein